MGTTRLRGLPAATAGSTGAALAQLLLLMLLSTEQTVRATAVATEAAGGAPPRPPPLPPPVPQVHIRIVEPANGTHVVGPSVSVRLGMHLSENGLHDAGHLYDICLTLDWGQDKVCGALTEALRHPITLHNVLPGWRRLRAWVEPADSGSEGGEGGLLHGIANSTSTFLVRRRGAGSGGGTGAGGGGEEEEETYDVTLARSRGGGVAARQCTGDACTSTVAGGVVKAGDALEEQGTEARAHYFDAIFKDALWAKGTAHSASGYGSDPSFTRQAGEALTSVLRELINASGPQQRIRLLDVPCGDMAWMPGVVAPFMGAAAASEAAASEAASASEYTALEYTGFDISSLVVRENQRRFAAQPAFAFATFDVVEQDILPRGRFDLIFCRHLMFHLTPEHNLRLLRRFEQSGAKFLMATTYLRADENDRDFVLAFGHKINLFRPPYCMRDPIRMYVDGEADMMLGLWEIADSDGNVLPLTGWDKECMK